MPIKPLLQAARPAPPRRARAALLAAGAGLAVLAGTGLGRAAQPQLELFVSRAFAPGTMTLHTGDSVYIVNDDGGSIHHPYVRSEAFSFDQGDLGPGHDSKVTFLVAGHFVIGCAIHPNLRSRITVE